MPFDAAAAKRRLLEKNRPPDFADPLTGYPPTDEDELSTLLALFHQEGKIAWNRVRLYSVHNQPTEKTADELFQGTNVVSEYRLFWQSDQQKNTWGQKRPDLVFLAGSREAVVLVENKIGHGGTENTRDQLRRYMAFLASSSIRRRVLVVLSGEEFFQAGWYADELRQVLNDAIKGYLMRWEEVFSSFR